MSRFPLYSAYINSLRTAHGSRSWPRLLGWRLPQVDRVLDLRHRSRLDGMDAAPGAIGERLQVSAKDASEAP